MTQLALTFPPVYHTRLERVPLNGRFQRWLGDMKDLRGTGWDVTVLHGPDHAVALACRQEPAP